MGWDGHHIGRRSSKSTSVLIRKDKKYIQRQERQKKQGYILVRVVPEQVCSLCIRLCVFAFVVSCFSRSALHRLSFSATHCSTQSLP